MGSTTQVAQTSRSAAAARSRHSPSPLIRWHLLSLDAPSVAALWTWFIARACGVRLPLASSLAMALAVWILYAADRLLDARSLGSPGPSHRRTSEPLEARHLFHHRYSLRFGAGVIATAFVLAALLPQLDPAAIRLYMVEGALLAAWFLMLHATPVGARLPKELVVGVFFASAVFTPTVARHPELRASLLPCAVLFAALCTLNCLFISQWEKQPGIEVSNPLIRLAAPRLPELTACELLTALAAAVLLPGPDRFIALAIACAGTLLLLLHMLQRSDRLCGTTLRAAADLALLTPLALLPFLR